MKPGVRRCTCNPRQVQSTDLKSSYSEDEARGLITHGLPEQFSKTLSNNNNNNANNNNNNASLPATFYVNLTQMQSSNRKEPQLKNASMGWGVGRHVGYFLD